MLKFTLTNRPKIHFGENSVKELDTRAYENILIVYGSQRIEKNKMLEEIKTQIGNKKIKLFKGISPNPKLSEVELAIALCKEKNIDLIIAIGGGSVIDAAKAISIGAKNEHKIWDIITKKKEINEKIDLYTIPTMIATGSETNDIFVILNDELNVKRSLKTEYAYPVCALVDPKYTLTISKRQTIAGIVDAISHLLEQYVNDKNFTTINNVLITYLKRLIEIGPKLVENLDDLNLREEHMYIALMGYNGDYRTQVGGDWACHGLDYGLAGEFNTIHGEGLAVIMPHWIKYIGENFSNISKLKHLAHELFQIEEKDEKKATQKLAYELQSFFKKIDAPNTFEDMNVNIKEKIDIMVEKSQFVKPLGATYNLGEKDIKKIYESCLVLIKK